MSDTKCHWKPESGWFTAEHTRECNEPACPGCKPCPKSHCAVRSRCSSHVATDSGIYTCPKCIGRTRRDINKILDCYADLPFEYEFSGVESEVLNLHGPAAYPGQWSERRKRLIAVYTERGWCDFPKHTAMAPDDEHHPYAVLGRWDMAIRESYTQPTDLFVTVASAAEYLAGDILDKFAHTQEFELFAKDISACLTHLEDTLALSKRPEQGAPCPGCRELHEGTERKAPRLQKRLAEHHPRIPEGEVCQATKCRTCAGDFDTWHCPTNPQHHWDHVSYRNRVDGDYVEHASELPAIELAERIGVPLSTFRKWTAKSWNKEARRYDEPRLKARRKGQDGRKVYSVADALRIANREAA